MAAVESGGFRACADKLSISQAAVSHHIKNLELELGHPLFVRRRGSVAGVTQRGVDAYRQAKDLLDNAGRFKKLGDAALPDAVRRLRIEADAVLDGLLAKKIAGFIASNGTLEISLRQSFFEQMAENLSNDDVDLIYFYSRGPVREFESTFCWSEPISICARFDHPLFSGAPVALEALADFPFVAPPKNSHFRRSVDQILREAGLQTYPIAFEVDNASLAREAVINGSAISAVISRYLDEELSRFPVRAVPIRDVTLALEVRRAIHPRLALDRTVERFTECLGTHAADDEVPNSSS